MLFLSLGSNYKFTQAIKHCFATGDENDSALLQKLLVDRYHGKKSLLFSRGRDALASGIRTATGGSGSVIITSLTCYSVVDAVKVAGCQPVFTDISSDTLQTDLNELEAIIKTSKAKAIVIQNTLGIPIDIERVQSLAKKYQLVIIEDIAHAVGGHYSDGSEIGSVGDLTVLSFGRDKLLDTINGGALVIRSEKLSNVINPPIFFPEISRQLQDRIYPLIGWKARLLFPIGLGKYIIAIAYRLGLAKRSADGEADPKMRLPHWQAKLAYGQLNYLDLTIKQRLAKQKRYLSKLRHLSPNLSSNAIRLPLLVANRDEVMAALESAGYHIKDSWYEVPVSPERLYHLVDFNQHNFPKVSEISKHCINLPTHQLVQDEDIDTISKIVEHEAKPWNM